MGNHFHGTMHRSQSHPVIGSLDSINNFINYWVEYCNPVHKNFVKNLKPSQIWRKKIY